MPLTDAACRAAKSGHKVIEIADGRGLFLTVSQTGHKAWVLRYKEGKQSRRITLGTFAPRSPEHLGVAAARAKAAQHKADRKPGLILVPAPAEPKTASKLPGLTVNQGFARYMRERWGSGTREVDDKRNRARWSWFERHFEPLIGEKLLADLTKDEVKALLRDRHRAMKDAGNTGRGIGNLQADFSAFLGWCAENDDVTGLKANPINRMKKIDSAIERDRWFDRDECGWFLVANCEVGSGYAQPFELLLRAGCRLSDIFNLTPSMIVLNNDDQGPHLLIPETKNEQDQVIPLTKQMLELLPKLKGLPHDRVIWPVTHSTSKVKARIEERMNELAGRTLANWRLHDFRTTVGSHLDTFGVDDRVIERILGHKEPNIAKRTYRRYAFYAERKEALQKWNDLLDQLHAKASTGGVREVRRGSFG